MDLKELKNLLKIEEGNPEEINKAFETLILHIAENFESLNKSLKDIEGKFNEFEIAQKDFNKDASILKQRLDVLEGKMNTIEKSMGDIQETLRDISKELAVLGYIKESIQRVAEGRTSSISAQIVGGVVSSLITILVLGAMWGYFQIHK